MPKVIGLIEDPLIHQKGFASPHTCQSIAAVGEIMERVCGVSIVSAKINVVKLKPATQTAKTPSPKDKLKIKTKSKDNDWYDAAFKRFSISLNRTNQQRDPLATLSPPIKPGLQ